MTRTPEEQRRADLVVSMWRDVLVAQNPDAVDRYFTPNYIQHSSLAAPGLDALKAWLRKIRIESPQATQEMKRVFVEGDHVITHNHVVRFPGDPGLAVVDIFRIEGDRIAEHWDVIQEINPNGPNTNSPF
jgi:predicted SnoaL-like aldol condensation-catalyzing enzyme